MCPVCVQSPIRCPQSPGSAGRVLSAEVGVQNCLTGQPFPQSPWASLAAGAVLLLLGARKGPPASTASRNGKGRVGRGSLYQSGPLPSLPQGCEDSPGERDGAALFEMFLTSFPAPGRGPASPSWGGPLFSPPILPPSPALLGQPEFPAAACHPFTLTSFGSSQRSRL